MYDDVDKPHEDMDLVDTLRRGVRSSDSCLGQMDSLGQPGY